MLPQRSEVTLIPPARPAFFSGPRPPDFSFFSYSAARPLGGGPIVAAFPSFNFFAVRGFISTVYSARSILDLGLLDLLGRDLSFSVLSFMKLGTAKNPRSFPWFSLIASANFFSSSILSSSSSMMSYIFSLKFSSMDWACLIVALVFEI